MNEYYAGDYLKLAIFYASYLYFPAAAFLLHAIATRPRRRPIAALLLAPLTVLAYARFVEPRILLTVEHDVALDRCFAEDGALRVALFSDLHNGFFANAIKAPRVARRVNEADPDIVLIAGDFVLKLDPEKHPETFAALATIEAPVFGVLGNHDIGRPGADVSLSLEATLKSHRVNVLNNVVRVTETDGATVEIAGLSDLWGREQDPSILRDRGAAPRLALTHNPGTIKTLAPEETVDLLFAGHTHGGQINIPFVTCRIYYTACEIARYGYAKTPRGPVFVTSGTGMVDLPMRFNAVPRIDVINLSWRACDKAPG